MDFSGSLIFPVPAMLKRPIKFDGTWAGAIVDATAAIPALLRMKGNRRFPFLRVGYVYIYLADFHTMVAPVTDIWIE
jgi:hypothetical protein